MKRLVVFAVLVGLMWCTGAVSAADEVEVLGVKMPKTKVVEGKTLTLNGVAYRTAALGFVKVYAVGFYLENPTQDAKEVIHSDQVKQLYFHYLTSKATAEKLRDGFIDLIKTCNPEELVMRNKADIERYAAWLDKDMQPGLTSVSTYVPGKGLTLEYQGETRGTISNKEFIEMYYRYNFGEKANPDIRDGLLGK
jgi:hypothetical protein